MRRPSLLHSASRRHGHFQLQAPVFNDVSDDGRFFVYRGPGPEPGTTQLYLRLADALEATPIPDTEGGIAPSISPDGERLAVQVDGELRVIPLGGGV
ncbi:MAG: hypothetical protein ACO2YV_06930, partial [Pseudomonadales bacterium]